MRFLGEGAGDRDGRRKLSLDGTPLDSPLQVPRGGGGETFLAKGLATRRRWRRAAGSWARASQCCQPLCQAVAARTTHSFSRPARACPLPRGRSLPRERREHVETRESGSQSLSLFETLDTFLHSRADSTPRTHQGAGKGCLGKGGGGRSKE